MITPVPVHCFSITFTIKAKTRNVQWRKDKFDSPYMIRGFLIILNNFLKISLDYCSRIVFTVRILITKHIKSFDVFLAQLLKSYCSHPGRTCSRSRSRFRSHFRYRSRSRHTLLKFSRSIYLDNQLSESIHTWTIGTL